MTDGIGSFRPTIYYPNGTPVEHTQDNWQRGRIAFDLADDEDLADSGDEEAAARLKTARTLHLRRLAPAAFTGV